MICTLIYTFTQDSKFQDSLSLFVHDSKFQVNQQCFATAKKLKHGE